MMCGSAVHLPSLHVLVDLCQDTRAQLPIAGQNHLATSVTRIVELKPSGKIDFEALT